ncbi:MAG: hypothetical protein KY396_06700 [Actinobacteria bacterium]|nr:hypothetical protein [Actinomycetota bacterium]
MTPGPEPTRAPARPPRRRVALTVLVLALLAGATAAFAFTEKLKLDGRAVTATRVRSAFSPTCGCPTRFARIVVTLRERGPVGADIVDEEGRHVRTLEPRASRTPREAPFRWDGRDEAGRLVADGIYRIRIRLPDEDRALLVPRRLRVDTSPPALEIVAVQPRVLAPDEELRVRFTTDEAVRPLLVVDGRRVARAGFARPGRRTITWDGTSGGVPARAGSHALVLRVRDRAGNVTASEAVTVRVGPANAVYSDAAPRPAHELADNANEGAMIMSTGVRRAIEMGVGAAPGGRAA